MITSRNAWAANCLAAILAVGAASPALAQEAPLAYTITSKEVTRSVQTAVDFNNQGEVLFNEEGTSWFDGNMFIWDSGSGTTQYLPLKNASGDSIDDAGFINGIQFQASALNPSGSLVRMRFDSQSGTASVGWTDEKVKNVIPGDALAILNQSLIPLNTETYKTGLDGVIAMNDRGQFLAEGFSYSLLNPGAGTSRWVAVFTPVPEASTVSMCLLGLCGVAWAARRGPRMSKTVEIA